MRLRLTKSALVAGLLASSGAALACTDVGCDPVWSLFGGAQACHNRAVIAPGNDSRVNLLALLRDSAGLGLIGPAQGGGAYPKPEYDEESFGHTFLDWGMLSRDGKPEGEAGLLSNVGPCERAAAAIPLFNAALAANRGVPARERAALSAARTGLAARCDAPASVQPEWPAGIASAPGKAFLGYLAASDAFYSARWDEARGGFAALVTAPDPWVAETARFMVARAEFGAALAHAMDEYGYFAGLKGVDKAAAVRGRAALAAYVKAYSKGLYAASAQGLERRGMWLTADFAALGERYETLLAAVSKDGAPLVDLIQEADNKYLANSDNPNPMGGGLMLLAAADLMRMRVADPSEGEVYDTKPLDAAALASQQASFLRAPELYAFLQANHAFYVGKDYARVLQLIPDDARRSSYTPLAFSRQVLRGQALAANGDPSEAGFWQELLGGAQALWQRPTVELGLALNWERHGKLAQVFAPGLPITDRMVREILIAHSAGPALLRSAALDTARPQHERDAALFTLLYKQLSRGDYAGFGANNALVRADAATDGQTSFETEAPIGLGLFTKGRTAQASFGCPSLAATAAVLAANPRDTHAQLCLGEFWRLNNFDSYTALDTAPARGALGGAANEFPGAPTPRSAFYAAAIANPRTAPADRAYALFRAINCYAPSGYNACGGDEAPKAQRKAWFDTLKRAYPRSPWAQKLRFYW